MEFYHLPPLKTVDIPIQFPTKQPPAPDPRRMLLDYAKIALAILRVSVNDLRTDLARLPVPNKYRPHITWGPPRPVSQGNLSMWITGASPMPWFRVAGLMALLELKFFQFMAADDTPENFLSELLQLSLRHHALITREPELGPFLHPYRVGIYRRLQKDRSKSKAHERLFQEYKKVMPSKVLDAIAQAAGQ